MDGYIAKATINRPNKLNALNAEVMDSLKNLCLGGKQQIGKVCYHRGAKPLPAKKESDQNLMPSSPEQIFQNLSAWIVLQPKSNSLTMGRSAVGLTKPTIAMVDGFALGGGCEVACSCDIRIASDRAKFGTPEINLGLIPGYGATQRLAKLIGYGKTLEMVMTGEMINAQEAKSIGLVNHVCAPEELEAVTLDMANKIASKSVFTLAAAKRTIRASLNNTLIKVWQ